ncbi:MAG: hypothetical protein WED07_02150 [Candidatus Freyarchaeum deiterrae]
MVKTNKKKIALSLVVILTLLTVIAVPLILQNNQTAFSPQNSILASTQTSNQIASKANPQPQPNFWWNQSWNYRIEVNVTEPGYADRVNEIAITNLTFAPTHCANNSIRVLYFSQSTNNWVEVPIQLENLTYSGTNITSCVLLFLCNVTNGGTSTYYVYYNNTYGGTAPTYTTPLNITIDPTGIHYFLFDTGVISGTYNIQYTNTGYDDDACFRIFMVNGTNIIPTTGLHSGLDRIDADDLQRWGSQPPYVPPYNALNWTAILIENGPLRATVRVYKTSVDRFTNTSLVGGGNYSGMNKTYTFYAYQGYVKANIVNTTGNYSTVPIYDFAVVNVTSQWNLYIDTYNLGAATNWHWTDKISSPQPFNYMSLVRNDGLGLALLGAPLWPDDTHGNRTSLEYGYGDTLPIDSGTLSFLFRNDGRPGDPQYGSVEYPIVIPFTYYIAGITQGFNQVTGTWYQVNKPTQTNNSSEKNKFYPLVANVTDWYNNPIPRANVNAYNDSALTSLSKTGVSNSTGQCLLLLNQNSTSNQYEDWVQANITNTYKNYTSDAMHWNPVDFSSPYSTITIRMNITTVYVEVWDNNTHRVQTANVTLNYVNASLTDISQNVDLFFANCSFYAWANVTLNIQIYTNATLETGITVYNYGTNTSVSQPINISEPKAFMVLLNRDIFAIPTSLIYLGSIINKYWTDNVSFYVWFNATGGSSIDNADWVNYNITTSSGSVYDANMTNVTGQPSGNYYANFNTTLVGLVGGASYTIIITAKPHDTNQLYPTPISIFLSVQSINVTVICDNGIGNPIIKTWSEFLNETTVIIHLFDTHNNVFLDGVNVTYTISGTSYVNQIMPPTGAKGTYQINGSVFGNLTTGNFTIKIVSSLQNYAINDYFIPVTINLASEIILAPSNKIQGSWNQNIPFYVVLVRQTDNTSITGANVSWIVQGTYINGTLTDNNNGTYSGQLANGTLSSGFYVLIIAASKQNYISNFTSLSLEVSGAQTSIGTALLIPELFGSSEFLFAGPLVQVENSWPVAPLSFTYLDANGNAVPNATVTVTGGLPVLGARSSAEGLGVSQVHALQLGAGSYMVLVPTQGLSPTSLPINIVISAPNYQSQQMSFVVTIKERAIAIGPTRVPVSTFLITLAAIAIPTSLFMGYTFLQRARIPAIIKRIDELIRAISRGEKVTVKLVPREKVIADILREELAIIAVEPRVEKYIPVELADLIVPLLVESKMKQKEAYAMALELKTAAPAEREKLLESVGIPGETSAIILQTIEEYEEKQVPIRRPRVKEPTEEEPAEEEAKESEEESTEEESKGKTRKAKGTEEEESKEDDEPED